MTTDTTVTITNPTDVKAIRGVVDELINSLVRESSEKELRKEILDEVKEKYGLDKKIIAKIAKDRFKDTHGKTVGEHEDYQAMYETLYSFNPALVDNSIETDKSEDDKE